MNKSNNSIRRSFNGYDLKLSAAAAADDEDTYSSLSCPRDRRQSEAASEAVVTANRTSGGSGGSSSSVYKFKSLSREEFRTQSRREFGFCDDSEDEDSVPAAYRSGSGGNYNRSIFYAKPK